MGEEVRAIVFSDLHSHKFKAFDRDNSRLEWTLKAFSHIAGIAKKEKVPLLFCGDLFHTPVMVDNHVLNRTMEIYDRVVEKQKISFFAISGNHDLSEKNGITHKSPSYLGAFKTAFSTFNLLDGNEFGVRRPGSFILHGIPYMNHDVDLGKEIRKYRKIIKKIDTQKNDPRILLLHSDCPGVIETNGVVLEENKAIPRNIDKYFRHWDWVLFGHIHHPQMISERCYMIGSPIHQTSSDKGEMGYWKIFTTKPPKFYGLIGFPKFIKLQKDEVILNSDSTTDYIIPYEETEKIEELEKGDFDLSLDRTILAKRYLKKKGIKDKEKRKALIKALNAEE